MASPDQQTVTSALSAEWETLDALLSDLSPDQWRTPSPLPGWSVQDVVSHIIGTESMFLGEPVPGVEEDVHQLPHVQNEVGAFNERWVIHLREQSPDAMLQRFRDVTARRREALESLSASQWESEAMGPVGPTTYGGFMQTRLFDCWMHELDIRDAVDIPGDEGGVRGELALDVISRAMGFVVAKKAHAPEGARVLFDLTGAVASQLRVAVAGRATLVEHFDDDPTVTLTLESSLFVRLAGGRVRAADHWDQISLRGDEALGRRIAENLAFMI